MIGEDACAVCMPVDVVAPGLEELWLGTSGRGRGTPSAEVGESESSRLGEGAVRATSGVCISRLISSASTGTGKFAGVSGGGMVNLDIVDFLAMSQMFS